MSQKLPSLRTLYRSEKGEGHVNHETSHVNVIKIYTTLQISGSPTLRVARGQEFCVKVCWQRRPHIEQVSLSRFHAMGSGVPNLVRIYLRSFSSNDSSYILKVFTPYDSEYLNRYY